MSVIPSKSAITPTPTSFAVVGDLGGRRRPLIRADGEFARVDRGLKDLGGIAAIGWTDVQDCKLLVLIGAIGAPNGVHRVEDSGGVGVHAGAGHAFGEDGGVAVDAGRGDGELTGVAGLGVDEETARGDEQRGAVVREAEDVLEAGAGIGGENLGLAAGEGEDADLVDAAIEGEGTEGNGFAVTGQGKAWDVGEGAGEVAEVAAVASNGEGVYAERADGVEDDFVS